MLQYDASDNSFIGAIPANLPSIPSLSYLNASNNQVNDLGEADNWNVSDTTTQLQTLDLSHNALTGEGQGARGAADWVGLCSRTGEWFWGHASHAITCVWGLQPPPAAHATFGHRPSCKFWQPMRHDP